MADDGAASSTDHLAIAQCIEVPVECDYYRVNARNGLRLRGGPGLEFDTIKNLAMGQQLHLTQYQGDWAGVGIDGDGFVDGWVFATYLQAVV